MVNITIQILERLMKGMTLDFAVTRVFEFEEKKDVPFNRKMLGSYLDSLQRGLDKNKDDYLALHNITEEQLKQANAEKRFTEGTSDKSLRQFEIKGYDQMLARIIEAPLKSSVKNDNPELSDKLMMIK